MPNPDKLVEVYSSFDHELATAALGVLLEHGIAGEMENMAIQHNLYVNFSMPQQYTVHVHENEKTAALKILMEKNFLNSQK